MRILGLYDVRSAKVSGSFSFDAGASGSVSFKANSCSPVERSTAIAAELAVETCGTRSAFDRRLPRVESARTDAEAGVATATATAARSARVRRITRIFEGGAYRVKRWVPTWSKIGRAALVQ